MANWWESMGITPDSPLWAMTQNPGQRTLSQYDSFRPDSLYWDLEAKGPLSGQDQLALKYAINDSVDMWLKENGYNLTPDQLDLVKKNNTYRSVFDTSRFATGGTEYQRNAYATLQKMLQDQGYESAAQPPATEPPDYMAEDDFGAGAQPPSGDRPDGVISTPPPPGFYDPPPATETPTGGYDPANIPTSTSTVRSGQNAFMNTYNANRPVAAASTPVVAGPAQQSTPWADAYLRARAEAEKPSTVRGMFAKELGDM